MPVVRGCQFPDELLYDVENHIWIQEVADGNLKLGMTSVAVAMAGQLVAFTPKKVGRSVKAGKSCATIESGKWVGPAKSAAAGRSLWPRLAGHPEARGLGIGQRDLDAGCRGGGAL
jgi:glycine cleavage system H protein